MSFKKIVLSLVLVLAPLAVLGQTKTIKGVIYEEETGETMPGATVSVVGSTKGVMTDRKARASNVGGEVLCIVA